MLRRLGRAQALKYEGDAFMETMQEALGLVEDPKERADTYAELAFEAAGRSGMWKRRPSKESMDDWTTKALSGVEYGSAAHVKALISRGYWDLPDAVECSTLASELAQELGDIPLRLYAWDARAINSFRIGDFDGALDMGNASV